DTRHVVVVPLHRTSITTLHVLVTASGEPAGRAELELDAAGQPAIAAGQILHLGPTTCQATPNGWRLTTSDVTPTDERAAPTRLPSRTARLLPLLERQATVASITPPSPGRWDDSEPRWTVATTDDLVIRCADLPADLAPGDMVETVELWARWWTRYGRHGAALTAHTLVTVISLKDHQ
ncbi:MAG: hypothetical protein ACKVWR_19480, partial [Acidimicrobiales bacterium]